MFDLDGTLVQIEKLKASSYAIAVQRLHGLSQPDQKAIEAYREIVGASRDITSRHIMEKPGLENDLQPLMTRYDHSFDLLIFLEQVDILSHLHQVRVVTFPPAINDRNAIFP